MAAPIIQVQVLGREEAERELLRLIKSMPAASDKAAKAGSEIVRAGAVNMIRTRGEVTGTRVTKSGTEINTYAALGDPIAGQLTSRTGALRASIRAEKRETGTYAVGPTMVYGAIHEFGGTTEAHTITARPGHFLRFAVGGEVLYRRSVQHPGSTMPKRPYLRPGYENNVGQVHAAMIKSLTAALKGAGYI